MANASEEFRHLDYSKLMDIRSKEKHILIDVREKSELNDTGAIPGAFHIPGDLPVGKPCVITDGRPDCSSSWKFPHPSSLKALTRSIGTVHFFYLSMNIDCRNIYEYVCHLVG